MPIKMEAVPELPEIKSEIKAEDFISASSTASNQSPHQQSHTPNLVEQIQNPANCGWGQFGYGNPEDLWVNGGVPFTSAPATTTHNNNAYFVQDSQLSELNGAGHHSQYTPNSSSSSTGTSSGGTAENPVDLSNSRPPPANASSAPHDQRNGNGGALLHDSNWQNSEASKYGYPNRYGGGGMLTPPDKLNGDHHNAAAAHWASGALTPAMAGSMQTPPSSPPMSIERFGVAKM